MSKVGGEDEQFDPREIFTKLFGGEAFYDYVSELDKRVCWADFRLVKSLLSKVFTLIMLWIVLILDFTSTMDVVMTPEERAEMEAAEQEAAGEAKGEPTPASVQTATAAADSADPTIPVTATGTTTTAPAAGGASTSAAEDSLRQLSLSNGERPAPTTTQNASASSSTDAVQKQREKEKAKAKAKISPEQKAKLEELEKKQDAEKEKRSVLASESHDDANLSGSKIYRISWYRGFDHLWMPRIQVTSTIRRPRCLKGESGRKRRI